MKSNRFVSVTAVIALLLAACASPPGAVERAAGSGQASAPAPATAATVDSALLVEALNADRAVQPGAEEIFEFKVVNATDQPMPVVIALEHADGQRWRTSLCAEKQCLLGDGSQPTKTDPIILPPYLELAFQAHLFVDATARSGQQTALTLRVEPLTEAAMPTTVPLTAQVSQR